MTVDTSPRTIRKNTLLLAGCMAVFASAIQLSIALATVTFVLVTGVEGLLGLGPAIFLTSAGLAALVGGRAMDVVGRVPVLAAGFVCGIGGNGLTALAAYTDSVAALLGGFFLIGCGNGIISLTRTAGGDMYPQERRARGISFVLFGSVFGAILGPAVFVPLFAGRDLEPEQLVVPWLASAGILVIGLVLTAFIRPDPRRIAEAFVSRDAAVDAPADRAASLRDLVRRPGVMSALVASLASYSIMVSVMNLTGHVVVENHGHEPDSVFPIIAAHVVGMFGLVLVVGDLIDRLGRRPALVGGLLLMGLSTISLTWFASVPAIGVVMFGLGLGWTFSFVAASAELVDRSRPLERGKLIGFNDLCSSVLGAAFALLGGYLLSELGPSGLAVAATLVVVVPALLVLRLRSARREDEPALGTLTPR